MLAGQVYPNTTNPHVTTGDGMAMAYRAKASIKDMEFCQFHPSGFYQGPEASGQTFLISEAVRGEGGLLYNMGGQRFMSKYDDRLELAPRDVVARSIHDQVGPKPLPELAASRPQRSGKPAWTSDHACVIV